MIEMLGEAWPPMSAPDLAPDDDDDSVLTSTVPYTQMIWQYGLRRKPLAQHKPVCRMQSAKWNSGQRIGVSPLMRVKQPKCFSLYQPSQSSSDLR